MMSYVLQLLEKNVKLYHGLKKQLALRGLSDGFVREVGQRFTTVREAALREGKRSYLVNEVQMVIRYR